MKTEKEDKQNWRSFLSEICQCKIEKGRANLLRRWVDLKEYIAALEQELSSVENGFNMSENPWAMLYEISVRNFRILFEKK